MFAPGDPESPYSWSRLKRRYITAISGLLSINATFASSIPAGIVLQMEEKFGFGSEVATLTISIFVAGYCVCPLLWGPLPERYGRRGPLIISFNTASIVVFRFLSRNFAASGLIVSTTVIADILDARARGKAFSVITLAPSAGPSLAPIVSGFIAKESVQKTVGTPFALMTREPILVALTIYMSAFVYLLFEAYPIVFAIGHHMNAGILGLMFLPIFLGGTFVVLSYLMLWKPRYERLAVQHAPSPVRPEFHLEQAICVAPLFATAFFWFGWTSYPHIYLSFAASALAANTVVRSLFGAGFPLFATQMYDALDPRWASTLLGFVALALMPIPFVLFRFGPALGERSRYAPKQPSMAAKPATGPRAV
ncbi:uncharacterized protein PHACADRAFT_159539 [Phanerochaete carnosa HHB-10118-sp]|uniref:Major facilitator superfamily (MFS) profile domain-containing protein n=1 Tax=Phanerochaete carnosa (strain HHB-10118-sp) TaxID=650164 RepID=K5V6T4_PHACS|nr:uncharacterized protein PHACADRAFT_159539 [Phanerochaete carnosa HHB-10118-sp]EKM58431.1 hypothetical protein PHACADRAFT_159539 [Phanerochaete carnosa HHB-10118-sp]